MLRAKIHTLIAVILKKKKKSPQVPVIFHLNIAELILISHYKTYILPTVMLFLPFMSNHSTQSTEKKKKNLRPNKINCL